FYSGCVGAANHFDSLLGGSQDNGSSRPDTGLQWVETYGGDGCDCGVDQQFPNVVYASSQEGGYGISADSGITFHDLPALPLFADESPPFYSPLAIDPSDGTRIYAGADH